MDILFFGQIVITFIICKGYDALKVNITPNNTVESGASVSLNCSFIPVHDEDVNLINLEARNEPSDSFHNIAAFYLTGRNKDPFLIKPYGQYLTGRVNLTNPTSSKKVAIMLFNRITCEDAKEYRCAVQYEIGGNAKTMQSNTTTITVFCSTEAGTTTSMPENMTTMEGTMTTKNSSGLNDANSIIVPVASFVACLLLPILTL